MNLAVGFSDTLEILAFRWKMIRKFRVRVIFFITALAALFLLFALSYVSDLLKFGAQLPSNIQDNSLAQLHSIAIAYLRTFLTSGGLLAASTVLAGLFGSLFLIPLLGYTASGMVPSGDIVSVRRNDYHRLSDSLVLQFFSSISLIQIVVILLLNSLISLTSEAPGIAVLIGWGVWLIFTFATTLVSWLFEYVHRRFGAYAKYVLTGVIFAAGGLIYLMFPQQANNLFGISQFYIDLVRRTGDYAPWQLALILLGFLGVLAALFGLISLVGSQTLNLAERPSKRKARSIALFGTKKPRISLYTFMLNNVLRQSNIRKPLIFATLFALLSVITFAGSVQVLQSLIFVIPLIVTMSWGANTFGILGPGVAWLLSLPNGRRNMLRNILAVQFTLIAILHAAVLLPLIFVFRAPVVNVLNFVLCTAITSVIMSRSAIAKSVHAPERYRVHIRGENVLPPAKALAYLARFVFGAGTIGLVFFLLPVSSGLSGFSGPLASFAGLLAIGGYQLVRFNFLQRRWRADTQLVERIITTVGTN